MMKKIVFLIPILILFSCDDNLFNEGEIINQEVKTDDFHQIEINDIFDVYFYQGTNNKINVRGGSNLIPNIKCKVDNGQLTIDDQNTARWSRDYEKIQLHITVDSLRLLTLNAPSSIICVDTIKTPELKIFSIADYADISILISCDNFFLVNSGTSGGQATIKGSTYSFGFWARASFQLYADEFVANKITAKNESIGNCYIHATEYLSAEILNSGLIYYKGNPETIEYVNEKARENLIKED
ncbi:MAG: GIN domain-containing protein [Bacteroidota bacterium]